MKKQDKNNARARYSMKKQESKRKKIEFKLTFDEWYNWWLSHGVDKDFPHTPGNKNKTLGDQLCMCRNNDTGPYELSNIYCASRKQNTSDARKFNPTIGKDHPRVRIIGTPLGTFTGFNDACKAHKCSESTLRKKIKNEPGFRFLDKKQGGAQPIMTPMGKFKSIKAAAEAYGIHPYSMRMRCKRNPTEYYYLNKKKKK